MSQAHRLDPLSRQIGIEWGWVAYLLRRDTDAEARIRQALELDPNSAQAHYRLGLVEIQRGHYREAITLITRAIELGAFAPYSSGALAFAQAKSGNRAAALAIVKDLERRSSKELVPPVAIAIAYGALGETTKGFEWLNRGIDEKDIYIPENFFDPLLDPLRKDPRFSQILRRMDLAPTARDSSAARQP
jgi:tetratricopeptide (TPR) repeat protein